MGWSNTKQNVLDHKIRVKRKGKYSSDEIWENIPSPTNVYPKVNGCISDRYLYKSNLGSGSYSKVDLYWYSDNEKSLVAIKSMPKTIEKWKEMLKKKRQGLYQHCLKVSIYHEIDVVSRLDHPWIIKYLDSYEDETSVNAIMEFSPGTTLDIAATWFAKGFWEGKLSIMYLLCKTVHHLKNQNIVHRDLKPKNILIIRNDELKFGYSLKLIDFGLSQKDKNDKSFAGSPQFMAPEAFQKKSDFCSDVWSLGIIFYNLISGTFPFEGETYAELFEAVSYDYLEFSPTSVWEDTPMEVIDLITKMLNWDPKNRIKIEDVVNHPCFADLIKTSKQTELTDNEIERLNKFKRLSSLSRGLLSYAVRYIPQEKTESISEKFLNLDGNNLGYLPIINSTSMTLKSQRSRKNSSLSNWETYMTTKATLMGGRNRLTYSEFVAALIPLKLFKCKSVSQGIFEDLNPNLEYSEIVPEAFVRSSFFIDKNEAMKRDLYELLEPKNGVTQSWLDEYLNNIKF